MSQRKEKNEFRLEKGQDLDRTEKKQPKYQEDSLEPVYRESNEGEREQDPLVNQLARRYQHELEESEYTHAEDTKKAIYYLNNKKKKQKLRAVSVEHSREKKFIKQAHREEMRSFNLSWIEVFERQKIYERLQVRKLHELKQKDTHKYRQQVMRRCQSAKPSRKIAEIQYLEKTEKILRKRGQTPELKRIRSDKKKLRAECESEQKKIIDQIVWQEEKKFEERQTKRYYSFMHRINETRQDNERRYRRQERRLKQKYKNIVRKLEHEQKVQLQYLTLNF